MGEGRKDDAHKPRPSLLPVAGLFEVIRVLEFGAAKYAEGNWRQVKEAERRYVDAALRHVLAHVDGETSDPESNLPHLAHAACCLLFVLDLRAARAGRPQVDAAPAPAPTPPLSSRPDWQRLGEDRFRRELEEKRRQERIDNRPDPLAPVLCDNR